MQRPLTNSNVFRSHLVAAYSSPSSSSSSSSSPSSSSSSSELSKTLDSFLNGSSAEYFDDLYQAWSVDPSSVDAAWNSFFEQHLPLLLERGYARKSTNATSHTNDATTPSSSASHFTPTTMNSLEALSSPQCAASILEHMKVQLLVRAYQVRGHHRANLDPLGILHPDLDFCPAPELDPEYYGLDGSAMEREFLLGEGMLPHFRRKDRETMKLSEILAKLKETYCHTIGIEYSHIPDRAQCDWIRSRFEVPVKYSFTKEEKHAILDRLVWSDSFERFVHSKYPGEKRFGLEGCEALIPGMKMLIDQSVEYGVESIVLGMPHRGRLNVLSNVVRKPNESIFCEFNGLVDSSIAGSGDVKYHLGMNYERPTPSGKRVHLSLVANPSHLEAVNPVVQGKTKALQFYMNDAHEFKKAMGVLLHGDAAFAAQGVVYESLGFSELPCYTTGGICHIIVNNQIGFTTDPRFARSTPYCTEIAKSMNSPIIHVNADDVEAVVFACKLAADWRNTYKKDVVLDMIGYRRHGHNEFDEPSFTQPRMYKAIASKTRALDIYIEKLLKEGTMTVEEIDATKSRVWSLLETSYENSKTYKPTVKEWLTSTWNGFKSPKEIATQVSPPYDTGVDEETIRNIGAAVSNPPTGFDLHRGLAKILDVRRKCIENGEGIDMATAEALAFGTLLLEGTHVRLSGQDVERGTFSHRHAVLHDQSNERQYIPLAHLDPSQAQFTVCNSSLSEFGVLGFELGYSLVNPRSLVLWEAQFGDFVNNAQCIIDQFIVSGERKWLQRSGLTMLLPHGFDGQGPEHSSCRIERFLQLCDDDPNVFPDFTPEKCRQIQDCNMQVCYTSTPANYFHMLRRQVHRDFRKPLIVANSKALLRHPLARSNISEFSSGTKFVRVYPEAHPADLVSKEKVKTVIFCSGQVYYTLLKAREANQVKNVALLRVEQISPFPFDLVAKEISEYTGASRITWAQEEPLNMGMWTYVQPRFKTAMKHVHSPLEISVVARPPSAAVATGMKKVHVAEEEELIAQALYGKSIKSKKNTNGAPIY